MNKKQYIFPVVLFVAAAVLIMLMIPSGGRYLQHYNLGELWKSETLTAPFDFSINKSETELINDIQHARKSYIPVYSYDDGVQPRVRTALLSVMAPVGGSADPSAELEKLLTFIYQKGIVVAIDHSFADADGNRFIRIDRSGTLETVSVREVFTSAAAAEYINENIQSVDSLSIARQMLLPNLTYSPTLNTNLREHELKNIARTKGVVYQNEVIVANGQLIDQDVFNKLNSLKEEYRNRLGTGHNFLSSEIGYALLVVILMGISFLYLYFFRNNFLSQKRNVLFVLTIYLLMIGLCAAVNRVDNLSVYIIPFAIIPIYILTFFDARMSIFELTAILLLCALIVPKPLEFIVINFIGGVLAVFALGRAYRRERIFLATAFIFLGNCVCYLGMVLIQAGGVEGFNIGMLIWFGVNAILFLGMYQLVYLFENVFGFVSDIKLFELSDTNQKLLLQLARQAPGTFQHTLQVANLAEAGAKAIGARSLLARTGALYHDIGKMDNPAYFTENRSSGNNPHDKLTPFQSVEIIRQHVTNGVAMARKQRLPAIIQEFITGHHGDSLIYYFYAKQKELDGGKEPDPARFRYQEAKPVRKEVSVVMMADAVEAASRSLSEYTEESIGKLVDKMVDVQMREGALADSELSFHDIRIIKEVFKEYLGNIYHTRISYPEREQTSEPEQTPEPVQ